VNEGRIEPERFTPDTLVMASVGTVLLPQDAQAKARTVASILVKT
jgi:hypothetical protein